LGCKAFAMGVFVCSDGNKRHRLALELADVQKELADSKQKAQVC